MKAPCRVRFVLAAAALALLLGCGGGGIEHWIAPIDPGDLIDLDWYYGSVALNPDTFAGSITANQPSQDESDAKALQVCGGGPCMIVLRFAGHGVCGASARATNWKYGVSTGSTRDDAMAKARDQCQANGGLNCEPGLAACND